MGMDPDSGNFMELMSAMDATPSETVFSTGEVVKIKNCYFRIKSIFNGGMSIEPISKEAAIAELGTKVASFRDRVV